MTCCVAKATSIHFVDDKCHIKQLKSEKIHKTYLNNHTQSSYITPLVINALRGGHAQTHIPTCEPKQFQETRLKNSNH